MSWSVGNTTDYTLLWKEESKSVTPGSERRRVLAISGASRSRAASGNKLTRGGRHNSHEKRDHILVDDAQSPPLGFDFQD